MATQALPFVLQSDSFHVAQFSAAGVRRLNRIRGFSREMLAGAFLLTAYTVHCLSIDVSMHESHTSGGFQPKGSLLLDLGLRGFPYSSNPIPVPNTG